jgi:hypothetical protein
VKSGKGYQRSGGVCCTHFQGRIIDASFVEMEEAIVAETSENFYQTSGTQPFLFGYHQM